MVISGVRGIGRRVFRRLPPPHARLRLRLLLAVTPRQRRGLPLQKTLAPVLHQPRDTFASSARRRSPRRPCRRAARALAQPATRSSARFPSAPVSCSPLACSAPAVRRQPRRRRVRGMTHRVGVRAPAFVFAFGAFEADALGVRRFASRLSEHPVPSEPVLHFSDASHLTSSAGDRSVFPRATVTSGRLRRRQGDAERRSAAAIGIVARRLPRGAARLATRRIPFRSLAAIPPAPAARRPRRRRRARASAFASARRAPRAGRSALSARDRPATERPGCAGPAPHGPGPSPPRIGPPLPAARLRRGFDLAPRMRATYAASASSLALKETEEDSR